MNKKISVVGFVVVILIISVLFFLMNLSNDQIISKNIQNKDHVRVFRLFAPHGGYSFYDENGNILPLSINVKKGEKIKILATSNQLDHNHGITIDEYEINEAILTTDLNNPKVIEFIADKTGTFKIWCKTCLTGSFGAHPWMKATLKVE